MPQGRELLFESANDKFVCEWVCRKRGVAITFTSWVPKNPTKAGMSLAFAKLEAELNKFDDDRLERIGLVIDADEDPLQRWGEVKRLLERYSYTNLPDAPDPAGTIIRQDDRPIFGAWLMPNNVDTGELEDFYVTLIRPDDQLWPQAAVVLKQLVERRFEDKNEIKAHVHTWLAWQHSPGRPMGHAIDILYEHFDLDVPSAHALTNWIGRLFNP